MQKTWVPGPVSQLPGKVPARQTLPPQTQETQRLSHDTYRDPRNLEFCLKSERKKNFQGEESVLIYVIYIFLFIPIQS